jgi:hypothetical protein
MASDDGLEKFDSERNKVQENGRDFWSFDENERTKVWETSVTVAGFKIPAQVPSFGSPSQTWGNQVT